MRPQMMRQGANSAVRFTTYTTLKQFVQGSVARPGYTLPSAITFGIAWAGDGVYDYAFRMSSRFILVSSLFLGSHPLIVSFPCPRAVSSVIKTQMQTLEARQQYRNSFHCAYRIFKEEGVFRFWTGTTPRLIRLVVSLWLLFLGWVSWADLFLFSFPRS